MDRMGLIAALENGGNGPFDPSAPIRLAATASDEPTKQEQIERALKRFAKMAPSKCCGRSIFVEETPQIAKWHFCSRVELAVHRYGSRFGRSLPGGSGHL